MSFFLTKLTSEYPITKKYTENGKEKAVPFSRGKAERIELEDIAEFGQLLDSLTDKHALMYGFNDEEKSVQWLAAKNKLSEYPGTIARSKYNFKFNSGCGLLFVDYDPAKMPLRKEVVIEKIYDIIPELRDAPMLWRPSAGSCIYNVKESDWETGLRGQHIYFLIDDQTKAKSIIYRIAAKFPDIDIKTPQGNRIDYQSATCEYPYEKRDEKADIRNISGKLLECEEYSDGTKESEKESTHKTSAALEWEIKMAQIRSGRKYHDNLLDISWGMAKEGLQKPFIIAMLNGAMLSVPEELRDQRWQDRLDDVTRIVEGAMGQAAPTIEELKSGTSAGGGLDDVYVPKQEDVTKKLAPDYPIGVMKDWPEPWGIIWENWKRFPANLNEPLLIPTIISFHCYFLNGHYRNIRGRRPNMYFLNLAESTAHKDTNSGDVLRDFGNAMREHGIMNSVFDNLHNNDSSLTSDTAFLKAIEAGDGKFFWLNTEATRVFQQLSNSGGNSNVMALSDKMIEVVDGHEITGKRKAGESVSTIKDPNVQIVFYAQPETIIKYMNNEMIDSGFLGRSLITLDTELPRVESLFDAPRSKVGNWKSLDRSLAEFYSRADLNGKLAEISLTKIAGHNLEIVKSFEQKVMQPMMGVGQAKSAEDLEEEKYNSEESNKSLYKMISRIANSTEQLYSVVLGVCREWDKHHGRIPREEVPLAPLLPIIEYWTKCKYYIVTEFITDNNDILAQGVEEVMREIITGINEHGAPKKLPKKWEKYREQIKSGLVPKFIILDRLRHRKSLIQRLNINSGELTAQINRTIHALISASILKEKHVRTSTLVNRRATFLYFHR